MEFVAHPQDIPITIIEVDDRVFPEIDAHREGFVGITFVSTVDYVKGKSVQMKLAEIDPNFSVFGRIAWSEKTADTYRIAIEFPEKNDCFSVRMIEQLSQIEHYRRQAKRQGRRLNYNDAAAEWIQQFAANFPAFTI